MDYILAKNKVITLWKEGGIAYERVKQEEYKQMYYAVLPHLTDRGTEWQQVVGGFFVHGAMSYDRFVGLRPKVAHDEQFDMSCRFVDALQKMDGVNVTVKTRHRK